MRKLLVIAVALVLACACAFAQAAAPKRVVPDFEPIDPNDVGDRSCPAAFELADISEEGGHAVIENIRLFTEDHYDIVDMNNLAVGDIIQVEGQDLPVEKVDNADGFIFINGGLVEENGAVFRSLEEEEGNGYVFCGFDDLSSYTERCQVTLPLSGKLVFNDSADIEKGPMIAEGEEALRALKGTEFEYFDQYNTTVVIEGGEIVEIDRAYVP